VQWPVRGDRPEGTARLFEDGRFFTDTGRARLVAVTPRGPAHAPNRAYPLILNTGRVRDHWHTLTRTGQSARLSAHVSEPYAELHPDDANRHGIEDGSLARVVSPRGGVVVRTRVSERQRPGSLFVPMHWTDQFASCARVGSLVEGVVDPISGQPESKHTPVRIEPLHTAWHGFLLSRERLNLKGVDYWSCARTGQTWRYELAGVADVGDWAHWARAVLGGGADWIEYSDAAAGRYRAARIVDGRLDVCLFVARAGALPGQERLLPLFDRSTLSTADRLAALSGQAGGSGTEPAGPVVCACFGVGETRIQEAITKQGLTTVEEIGELLQAGTNCGSCVPELRRLLQTEACGRESA